MLPKTIQKRGTYFFPATNTTAISFSLSKRKWNSALFLCGFRLLQISNIYVRTMNISIKMSSFFLGGGIVLLVGKFFPPSCRYNPRLWSIGGLACPTHTALEKLAASSFSCPTSGQKISPLIVTRERQIVWDYIEKEWRAGEGNKCVKRTWPSVTMKGCLLLREFL